MMERLVLWSWKRLRPPGGWLSFFLLLGAVLCFTTAIVVAEWTPEAAVVLPAALAGLLLGTLLAGRRTSPLLAWLLIIGYGLVLTITDLAQLSPWHILNRPEGTGRGEYVRQNLALLWDRTAGWLQAVLSGGSSEETAAFALGLGVLACLLAAYAAWSTYRQGQTLAGLSLLGVALALNGYLAGEGAQAWLVALFAACAILLAATMHYTSLEQEWAVSGTDYSGEIRLELLLVAAGVALSLLFVSFILPAIPFNALARAFQQTEAVQSVEDTLERAFAGVRQPAGGGTGSGPGGAGIMPRAFLLGNAPELSETIVMTATAGPASGLHWRAISYDVYTGRGWARSEERTETIPAGNPLPLPPVAAAQTLTQSVHWLLDDRLTQYTMGEPLRFDQEVTAFWRGVDDLARVNGREDRSYQVVSRRPPDDPALLRQASLADTPPVILGRYTALPEGIPERVHELAAEITAGLDTPYAQAQALERFLRQYPYSLEVAPTPAGRDPVDFFLFELQRGYCDYYASAMVVLARSIGLPARFAIGYQAQPPDENGVQTVRHINAHSWAEIYLAPYGWVEFEPTATFPGRPAAAGPPGEDSPGSPGIASTPPPIPAGPPLAAVERLRWLVLLPLALLLLALAAGWFWLRRSRRHTIGIVPWAYGELQKTAGLLGQPLSPSQTPAEFESAFLARLHSLSRPGLLQRLLAHSAEPVRLIVLAFTLRQYGATKPSPLVEITVRDAWQGLRRRLQAAGYLHRILARIQRSFPLED